MELFGLSFIIFTLSALGMAVGVIVKGSALKGSCATLDAGPRGYIKCTFCPARLTGHRSKCLESSEP